MSQQIPHQSIPVAGQVPMTREWFGYLAKQYRQLGGQGEALQPVTVGASPYIYQAQTNGLLIISGGTVSAIAYSRDRTAFYTLGQTSGLFPLFALDYIRVTYTVLPVLVFAP
jgi:hypothetical protein